MADTHTPTQVLREEAKRLTTELFRDTQKLAGSSNAAEALLGVIDKLASLAEQAPLAPVAVEAVQQPKQKCAMCRGVGSYGEPPKRCEFCAMVEIGDRYRALSAPAAPTAQVAPAEPEVWRHVKTGGLYEWLMSVVKEDDQSILVVYRSLADGVRWARPSREFHDGRFVRVTPFAFTAEAAQGALAPGEKWTPVAPAEPALIERIAQQWDGCMYETPGESIDIGSAIRAAAVVQANSPEIPDGSPAINSLKRIDSPPGRPDLHQWTGSDWVPVGWSVEAVAQAAKALEFAEYMAKRAETLIDSLNAYALLLQQADDGGFGPGADEQLDDARQDVTEHLTGLRSAIYEFRKRAARAGKGEA